MPNRSSGSETSLIAAMLSETSGFLDRNPTHLFHTLPEAAALGFVRTDSDEALLHEGKRWFPHHTITTKFETGQPIEQVVVLTTVAASPHTDLAIPVDDFVNGWKQFAQAAEIDHENHHISARTVPLQLITWVLRQNRKSPTDSWKTSLYNLNQLTQLRSSSTDEAQPFHEVASAIQEHQQRNADLLVSLFNSFVAPKLFSFLNRLQSQRIIPRSLTLESLHITSQDINHYSVFGNDRLNRIGLGRGPQSVPTIHIHSLLGNYVLRILQFVVKDEPTISNTMNASLRGRSAEELTVVERERFYRVLQEFNGEEFSLGSYASHAVSEMLELTGRSSLPPELEIVKSLDPFARIEMKILGERYTRELQHLLTRISPTSEIKELSFRAGNAAPTSHLAEGWSFTLEGATSHESLFEIVGEFSSWIETIRQETAQCFMPTGDATLTNREQIVSRLQRVRSAHDLPDGFVSAVAQLTPTTEMSKISEARLETAQPYGELRKFVQEAKIAHPLAWRISRAIFGQRRALPNEMRADGTRVNEKTFNPTIAAGLVVSMRLTESQGLQVKISLAHSHVGGIERTSGKVISGARAK